MRSVVVYYSKTGNTKAVAELLAKSLGCTAYSVNLIEKKGRGTKEDRYREKEMYDAALRASGDCDLVVVGTPTGLQKAKSMIQRFVKDVESDTVALFCTYDNKIGTKLTDLEETLMSRGTKVIGKMDLGLLKPGKFKEMDEIQKEEYKLKIIEFAELCKLIKKNKKN